VGNALRENLAEAGEIAETLQTLANPLVSLCG
jgi:hypothetical protein